MKFLCDNCKAKYQIADEKVAGKTVRMKCRKCGHNIEVRSAVTQTSVASSPPEAPAAPRPAAPKSPLATSLSSQQPRSPSTSPGGSALAGAFQRSVEQQPPPSAPFASGAGEPAISVSVTDEWYVAINGVPVGPVRISELRRKAAAGAVTDDSLCWQEGLEEWRPVRSVPELAAIVREAAQQNRVSLVNPPAPEPHRPSAPSKPPVPPRATAPSAPSAPRAPTPMPEPVRTEPPRTAPIVPPQRSNVVPLHAAARLSAPEPLEPAPVTAPLGGSAAALAMSPSTSSEIRPAPAPAAPPAPAPVADPFAVPPAPLAAPPPAAPAFSLSSPSLSSPSLVPPAPAAFAPAQPQAESRKGVPLWFWPVLALALAFGGGAAFFVFKQQPPPQPIVVQVPVSQPQPTQTTASNDVPPPTPTTEPSAAPSASVASNGTKVATGGKGGGTAPAPSQKGGAADLTGLLGGGGSGPAVGPGGGGAAGSGGGLDQAGVERVVAQHRIGVRRTCWERGSNDQKSSVNVTVNATVAPDGSVASTSSSGDDPVVAKCIEGQVKSWRFPAPGSSTQIAIPFKFVRQ